MLELYNWGDEETDKIYRSDIWPALPEYNSDLPQTIQGNDLRLLLEMCFENATYFSLQKSRWLRSKNGRMERHLEPYLIRSFVTQKWFGYDFSGLKQERDSICVNLYRAEVEAKEHLMRWMDDIFMNVIRCGRLSNSTQTLENLCIFSETGIIMGTISHESILAVEPQNDAFRQVLGRFGYWKRSQWTDFSGMPIDMSVFTQM